MAVKVVAQLGGKVMANHPSVSLDNLITIRSQEVETCRVKELSPWHIDDLKMVVKTGQMFVPPAQSETPLDTNQGDSNSFQLTT